MLTTPVAYITKLPIDPFPNRSPIYTPESDFPLRRPYNYSNDQQNTRLYPGLTSQYYVSWTYQFITSPESSDNFYTDEHPNAAMWMIISAGPNEESDHCWGEQWAQNTDQTVATEHSKSYAAWNLLRNRD